MRVLEIASKWAPRLAAGSLILLATSNVNAQLNAVRLAVDSGNWASDASWVVRGSDPAEDGAPGADDLASIQNGGVANVGSSVGDVAALSITSGSVALNSGGALTVGGQAIVGERGSLRVDGGTLTAGSFAMLGNIDLGGDLASDLSVGSSFPIATTGNVFGSPRSITVDGQAPILGRGLDLHMVTTDSGAAVEVRGVPTLVVDRLTGATSIKNYSAGDIGLSGYTIESPSELLIRTGRPRWDSLEDQDVPGWVEANPTRTTRFSEFSLGAAAVIGPGSELTLGSAYKGIGATPRQEDLTFSYLMADGGVFDGPVEYAGPANDLVLSIDPETGAASISHNSTLIDPFAVTGYSILSESGSLLVDNFTGIGGDSWVNANPQATALSELNSDPAASQLFNTGTSVSLGNIFNLEGSRDLVFRFSTADNALREGTVEFGQVDIGPPPCEPLNALAGDLNGDGTVNFPDFLVLSANFGSDVTSYSDGDINCDGAVGFPDFLQISANFGKSLGASAASVPEPGAGLMIMIGVLGMLKFRKRAAHVLALTVCATSLTFTADASAQALDGRFIRLDPDAPNAAINNTTEMRAIVAGDVFDAIFAEDITFELDLADNPLDFAGNDGSFNSFQSAYPNGVADNSMSNFLIYASGVVEIPEGTWTIGCGSDDGCFINMPGVSFDDTYNENGPALVAGDGEIFYNPGRGHDWTLGTFTVPAGGITTGIEIGMFEGGSDDSWEIAILDDAIDASEVADGNARRDFVGSQFLEMEHDGEFGWMFTGGAFMGGNPADFNGDGAVDAADAKVLEDNFGEATAMGDLNADGIVDLHDVSLFKPIFNAAQPGASVPEPASAGLIVCGCLAALGLRKRRS